ncbi:MAG: mismatch-specific DNA-glycosylase [Dehalococcoidia bacterium]|nr:mismatch-specific DNA-glycosylase [Dehalococcoidia bacterium]
MPPPTRPRTQASAETQHARQRRLAYAATLPTLPDLLRPALDLVFAGINPGERSAERGHYYGHPGNAFWRRLSASPLVTREVTAEDDAALLAEGIGFTDVVKRVITDSALITRAEFEASVPAFLARLAHASPRAVCFTATRPFEAVYPGQWRAHGWGRQDVPAPAGTPPETQVWVMPSPSGRAAGYHAQIDRVLADLAAALGRGVRGARTRGAA